jgi:uncharacterized protein Smg (DUF494 family)
VAAFSETFAAQLIDNQLGKKCLKDDFSYAKSEWVTIDTDGDGFAEYYYFNGDGFLVVNQTTPDGYVVNSKGQYVVDGIVQTKKIDSSNVDVSNNTDGTNYIISKKKENDAPKQDVFVDVGDNTNGMENDPNTIQPKVRKAMDLVIFWCNEDGEIIIPHSKKTLKYGLEGAGFKKDTINRALSEVSINWKEHALIRARRLLRIGYRRNSIKKIMSNNYLFTNDEIIYALDNLEATTATKKSIDQSDFIGMNYDEKKAKLFSLGFNEEQVKQAMLFLDED